MLSSSQDVFLKLSETTSSPKLFPSDCIRLYVQNSNVDYASFYMFFDLGLAVVQRANQNNVVRLEVKKTILAVVATIIGGGVRPRGKIQPNIMVSMSNRYTDMEEGI